MRSSQWDAIADITLVEERCATSRATTTTNTSWPGTSGRYAVGHINVVGNGDSRRQCVDPQSHTQRKFKNNKKLLPQRQNLKT